MNELILTTHVESGDYVFSSNTTSIDWEISPKLPEGLWLSNKHVLSGAVDVPVPRQQYNITVSNSAGSSSFLFYIEVNDCKEGFYVIRHVHETSTGQLILRRGEEVIDDVKMKISLADKWFCLPMGELTVFVNCTVSYGKCTVDLSSDRNVTFLNLVVPLQTEKETTFSLASKEAPTVAIDKPESILYFEQSATINFAYTDIYELPVFEPVLPSFITYDRYFHYAKVSNAPVGQYFFTVTVRNDRGSNSAAFQVFVDTCPDGKELLRFSISTRSISEATIYDLGGQERGFLNITSSYFRQNLCLPPAEYTISLKSYPLVPNPEPLHLFDTNKFVYESFPTDFTEAYKVERFVVGDHISLGSPMRFLSAASVNGKWTTASFNDHKWEEKKAGEWGVFDASHYTAFFRARFSVSDPAKYALLLLEMHLRNSAEVYLNGQLIRTYSQTVEGAGQNVTLSRMISATTFLVKGTNVLAIKLHARFSPSSSSPSSSMDDDEPILFDLRVHLTTTMCLTPQIDGLAMDDQANPDPSYPPSQAFGDHYSWWKGKQLPVNLRYFPENDFFIQPAQMRIATSSYDDGIPYSFRVYGQLVDHFLNHSVILEEEIGFVHRPSFLFKRDYELVPLRSSRPYNGFRVEFLDASNHTIVRAGYMAFFPCQDAECPKRLGWASTRVGSTTTGRCPFGTYGRNHRQCVREDVEPAWKEDRRMCLAKHSEKGFAFIDTGLHMEWVRDTMMDKVGKKATEIVVASLTVWEDQVSFPYIVMHEKETVSVDVVMRFTVEYDIGDYVYRKMELFKGNFTEKMRVYLQNIQTGADIYISSDPVLRVPIPWGTIITIIVVILSVLGAFVLGIACMYIYSRSGSKQSERKQLSHVRHGKKKEESLLDNAE